MRFSIQSAFLCALFCSPGSMADEPPRYATDVRPILATNCFACHGADEATREAELRLDVAPDRTLPDSAAAKAIIPGKPEDSELIARVTSTDPDLVMPPADSGHSLTKAQIEILKNWIQAGGAYETHWSFVPPVAAELSPMDDNGWCRGAIDHFVLLRLRDAGLTPSTQADPHTLIRRVSLDLTGLPPTPDVSDAFAKNPTPAEFEAIVDDLLKSPSFGEHWAAMWLDLARYADTKGYEKDQPRNIWRYRDWVIRALNEDMPFDQFTVEQISGDLLENASTEQILATAFHRNTMTNDEGGTDNEEFRIAAVKDRVDTTMQVWMGLTMGCAKCHSHKYDPISQHEYYQFLAFFNQTEDADRSDDNPRLATPTAEQRRQQTELTATVAELRKQYNVTSAEFTAAQRQWETTIAASPVWQHLQPKTVASSHGTTLQIQEDHSVLASGKMPGTDVYTLNLSTVTDVPLTALRIEALTHSSLPQQGPGRNAADPNFVLSEVTVAVVNESGEPVTTPALTNAQADFSQSNWEVAKAIDGNPETGWAISPQKSKPHTAIFSLTEPLSLAPGQLLQLKLSQQYAPNSLLLGHLRISASTADPKGLTPTVDSLSELASIAPKQRSTSQEQQLTEAFRKVYPQTAPLWTKIEQAESQLAEVQKAIVDTPIMRDLAADKQRETFVHVRGNFLDKGDPVAAGLPATFASSASADPANRLDVAKWLVSDSNPLTARVAVNRVWSRVFGRGIVETEEDFGTQGMLPTHPELLDWLAVNFQDRQQWSLKQLCKLIVMSATYQQSAVVSDASQNLDPENRWFSRGTRFRLSAEAVRDQALQASGLLSDKIGGPSVMPPQPDGMWRTTYSSLKWETPEGEDRYRRGLYTFLRRTSPYPSMLTFDGTSREVCQIRRIRTNTPLQALIAMNDPVFVEAAGALATAVRPLDGAARLQAMFRRVLIRPAASAELSRLQDLYNNTLIEFQQNTESAAALLRDANIVETPPQELAELAALTVVGTVVLNLDETLMRP